MKETIVSNKKYYLMLDQENDPDTWWLHLRKFLYAHGDKRGSFSLVKGSDPKCIEHTITIPWGEIYEHQTIHRIDFGIIGYEGESLVNIIDSKANPIKYNTVYEQFDPNAYKITCKYFAIDRKYPKRQTHINPYIPDLHLSCWPCRDMSQAKKDASYLLKDYLLHNMNKEIPVSSLTEENNAFAIEVTI